MGHDDSDHRSFWVSFPGVLAAVAALVTAIGRLLGALFAVGVLGDQEPTPPTPTTSAPSTTSAPHTTPTPHTTPAPHTTPTPHTTSAPHTTPAPPTPVIATKSMTVNMTADPQQNSPR